MRASVEGGGGCCLPGVASGAGAGGAGAGAAAAGLGAGGGGAGLGALGFWCIITMKLASVTPAAASVASSASTLPLWISTISGAGIFCVSESLARTSPMDASSAKSSSNFWLVLRGGIRGTGSSAVSAGAGWVGSGRGTSRFGRTCRSRAHVGLAFRRGVEWEDLGGSARFTRASASREPASSSSSRFGRRADARARRRRRRGVAGRASPQFIPPIQLQPASINNGRNGSGSALTVS